MGEKYKVSSVIRLEISFCLSFHFFSIVCTYDPDTFLSDLFLEGNKAVTKDHIAPEDVDVLEEENLVKQQSMEGTLDPKIAVQIRGLVKIYPGKKRPFCCCCCCCCCKETKPYTAVKVKKKKIFCIFQFSIFHKEVQTFSLFVW